MIHTYAPNNDADEVTKEDFYGKPQEVAEQVNRLLYKSVSDDRHKA